MIRYIFLLLVSSCSTKIEKLVAPKKIEPNEASQAVQISNELVETVQANSGAVNINEPLYWFGGIVLGVLLLSFSSKIFKK